jgi:hypothetical protein
MSRRSELAMIAYTIAVVLLGFVQFAHEQEWDTTTMPVMIASAVRP